MQLSPDEARQIIDLVHCPICGQPATHTAFTKTEHGFYMVVPAWCCGTDGCENSLEGPSYWMADLSD